MDGDRKRLDEGSGSVGDTRREPACELNPVVFRSSNIAISHPFPLFQPSSRQAGERTDELTCGTTSLGG